MFEEFSSQAMMSHYRLAEVVSSWGWHRCYIPWVLRVMSFMCLPWPMQDKASRISERLWKMICMLQAQPISLWQTPEIQVQEIHVKSEESFMYLEWYRLYYFQTKVLESGFPHTLSKGWNLMVRITSSKVKRNQNTKKLLDSWHLSCWAHPNCTL